MYARDSLSPIVLVRAAAPAMMPPTPASDTACVWSSPVASIVRVAPPDLP
jgi:hypothetical protein